MRQMGLEAICPNINLSKPATNYKVDLYLLRDLVIGRVHQVWATDLTYVPMRKDICISWRLLTCIADMCWYGQCQAAWMRVGVVRCCGMRWVVIRLRPFSILTKAVSLHRKSLPVSCWLRRYKWHQPPGSMDGKGQALDNILVERLWRPVKYEHIYLYAYADG